MRGPRGSCLIVCPLPNSNIEECKKQAQQKYLLKPLPRTKALRHKSFTWSENKEAKKLSESRTTLRNNSKALERCENNFAWHFWRYKVKYVSDVGTLLKRTWYIVNGIVLPWRWSFSAAPNDVHSGKFSVLFWSFLQLKAKNLSMIALLQTLW